MDKIEKIGQSVFQHGKFNNRIYLLKYDKYDNSDLLYRLDELACANGYGKIIAKVPASAQALFIMDGYSQEAYIPSFFGGKEDVIFMAKYFENTRSVIESESLGVFAKLLSVPTKNAEVVRPAGFDFRIAARSDTEEIAKLYQEVFKTYPFPITDTAYLNETMGNGSVIYFGVWDRGRGRLVGLSSVEMDVKNRNAEMTDFAVLPEYQGQKLALFLLHRMEYEMKMKHFKTLYTIARLNSPGMNRTFINCGYHFSGLLKNNTNISGQIESMNVYYKNIFKK